MPKKLKELSSLSMGLRHRLVFEAVEKFGLASIADVLDYIASEQNINLSSRNVKESLKKTVENDLKALIGVSGKMGVKYYYRDGLTEVPLDQIEENQDGSTKNKYNVKYYLLGGSNRIPGVNLLESSDVKIEIPNKSIMNLKVDRAFSVKEKKLLNIVFQKNGNEFYAVNFDENELPLGFLICRNYGELTPFLSIQKNLGNRNFRISLSHTSIERFLPEIRLGHCHINISPNKEFTITDLGSLNGTYFSKTSKNMVDLIFSKKITYPQKKASIKYPPRPRVDEDIDKMEFDKYYPFHNEFDWVKVNSSVSLPVDGYLIKVGKIIFYIGYSQLAVSGDGAKKAA